VKRDWILARSGLIRKSVGRLERGLVEPPGCEPARGFRPEAAFLDLPASPLGLRLEPRERLGHDLGGEPFALEPEADRRVSVATLGERLGPKRRNPSVVHEPGLLEGGERVLAGVGAGPVPLEPFLEPPPGKVAVAERSSGGADRLGSAELAPEQPRRVAVERAPDRQAGPHDGIGRHEPPRGAVELDLDLPPRPLAQRRDDSDLLLLV